MYDDLNEQLGELKEQLRSLERKQSQLTSCKKELSETRSQIEQLEAELSHHQQVLEKLHGLSFTHLLAVIRGIEDEQDQSLHQQVANSNGRLMTLKSALYGLEEEERGLLAQIEKLRNAEQDYKRVLAEKEKQIGSHPNSEVAQRLFDLAHQIADVKSQLKETGEALQAARQAQGALNDCLRSLDKARNWGVWDMMGGGTITTMIKRGHMDDAQSLMDNANYYLRRLARELQDVHGSFPKEIQANPGGFLHFADYFFDDLFVDWAVQSQINRASDAITDQYHRVSSLTRDLQHRTSSLEKSSEALTNTKKRLIEEASS